VMINTFLDDLLHFLEEVSRSGPGDKCPFHGKREAGVFSAEYHDMVELFGYKRPGAPSRYHCPLAGNHTAEDCLRDFSEKSRDFFYGLHPTRIQFYRHLNDPMKTEIARTVYTGNYVISMSALGYFIPFAGLKLRMAGPTLGRILKAAIREKFVSANVPLLHRRTPADAKREFRSGLSVEEGTIDLSDEFTRQFWGDVMLFSVEALTEEGFPGRRCEVAEIAPVVKTVRDRLWDTYRQQKSEVGGKTSKVRGYFSDGRRWWDGKESLSGAGENFRSLCSLVEDNFGRDSKALKHLSVQVREGAYTDVLVRAIHSFHEDAVLWDRLLKSEIMIGPDVGEC